MRSGKFPKGIEKNLLKIFQSNKYISLQVVNTRTGNIFLWASSIEKHLRERLRVGSDRVAAKEVAELLVERARAADHKQLTWERNGARYTGKVKIICDTLRAGGIEFVQHAFRGPPKEPWPGQPPS